MFKTKKYTVEEIHADFDAAEERINRELNEFLESINIVSESSQIRKAELLQELGFNKSEVFVKSKQARIEIEIKKKEKTKTEERLTRLKYLKDYYPDSKFITVEELDRLCAKYELIYAPGNAYIKDIPEKNLLEIKNGKELISNHLPEYDCIVTKVTFQDRHSIRHALKIRKMLLGFKFTCDANYTTERKLKEHFHELSLKHKYEITGTSYKDVTIDCTLKRGIFIAAPSSHFDLKGLTKKGFGNFVTESLTFSKPVEDPIGFEFVEKGLVRIRTKWGTPDDRSYLDPVLQ